MFAEGRFLWSTPAKVYGICTQRKLYLVINLDWLANYANPYMVLPLFATRFADYAGGIRVSFIQPRLF